MKDLFPIKSGKYVLTDEVYAHLKGTLVTYREWIDGEPFSVDGETIKADRKHKSKVEQLAADLNENFKVTKFSGVAKNGELFVLDSEHGPQPKVFETFYPWAPFEFQDNVNKLAGFNTPVDGLEIIAANQRFVVRRSMFRDVS